MKRRCFNCGKPWFEKPNDNRPYCSKKCHDITAKIIIKWAESNE